MSQASTKTRQSPLTLLQRYRVMRLVDGDTTTPDADLAKRAEGEIKRPVSVQTIRDYREVFGIAPVAQPTREQLLQRIRELEGQQRIEA